MHTNHRTLEAPCGEGEDHQYALQGWDVTSDGHTRLQLQAKELTDLMYCTYVQVVQGNAFSIPKIQRYEVCRLPPGVCMSPLLSLCSCIQTRSAVRVLSRVVMRKSLHVSTDAVVASMASLGITPLLHPFLFSMFFPSFFCQGSIGSQLSL